MRIKKSWLFGLFGFAVLGGVWLARYGIEPELMWWCMALASLPFARRRSLLAVIPVIGIGLILGLWRGASTWQQLETYKTHIGQKVELSGQVISDPVYARRGQLEFYAGKININGDSLPGKVRVRTYSPHVARADFIKIKGNLREGFGSYQAAMNYAEVQVSAQSGSPMEKFRSEFISRIYSAIAEPQASLGLGFLIGVRALLPPDLSDQLSVTGLTHIIAVSGYNLTILINICRRAFEKYSRYVAVLSSSALMGSFLLITGNSPSIQRASIVSFMGLLVWFYGRNMVPLTLLALSAAISAMLNPVFFWFDLGWHLSFLAFFGVLILAPLIVRRLYGKKRPKLLAGMIIETTSAQIMTAPLIAGVFHQFSVISLLANAIVLPLIPLAMLLTFVVGALNFVSFSLAALAAVPTQLILAFITNAVAALARVPWALAETTVTRTHIVVLICSLAVAMLGLRRGGTVSPATEENAILDAN